MSDLAEPLAGVLIGYGAGALTTYLLIRFGASLQAKRANFTPATANAPLAFMPPVGGLPKLSKVVRRIVPSDNKPDTEPPEFFTFPLAADDGTIIRVVVATRYLVRFVSMPNVARENWFGDKKVYGQLLKVGSAHGWLTRANGSAWEWSRDYRTLARRVMKLRENNIVLPSPARAREDV